MKEPSRNQSRIGTERIYLLLIVLLVISVTVIRQLDSTTYVEAINPRSVRTTLSLFLFFFLSGCFFVARKELPVFGKYLGLKGTVAVVIGYSLIILFGLFTIGFLNDYLYLLFSF